MAVGTDVEIQIQAQSAGRYPVQITLMDADRNRRHFEGYLDQRSWDPNSSPVQDGQQLFQWLFADDALKSAWDRLSEHLPYRLRLRIEVGAPELHAIPWELMQERINDRVSRRLAADTDTPFSRYPPGDWAPERALATRPIKILAAIANPEGLDDDLIPLEIETEQGIIADALQDLSSGQVRLSFLGTPVTLTRLEAELKRGYDFLHIVAHGTYSDRLKKAFLFLSDNDGDLSTTSEDDFAAMIDRLSHEQQPKLVFLGSCQGATRDSTNAFRGLAPALIEIGVPTVLAMQDSIPIVTAQEFTRVFYRQLFEHGQVDMASNEARSALLTGEFPGSSIPVLFSRLADNQLLEPLPGAVIETRPSEPETVYVAAGWFLMGSQPGKEIPRFEEGQDRIDLPAYRIGKYPVTKREYAEFIRRNRRQAVPTRAWIQRKPPAGLLDYPVVAVTWDDAQAYCRWLSAETGRTYRLPTEAEWEKAARGTEGQLYPWGDEWETGYSPEMRRVTPVTVGGNRRRKGTMPFLPQSTSPYGCYNMVGNVQEWTSTLWGSSRGEPDFPYPYDPEDGREDDTTQRWYYRVCRGGQVPDAEARVRCSSRDRARADSATRTRGFRVVMEV